MASGRPFRAFVSYCHADAVFAARLQRQLEAYRLPKRLADQVTPQPGEAPDRIGPVFRDREYLSAAEDLSAAVRDAIARSSALIVVASPNAVKSRWVEEEIQLFRELHPGAPILVANARGEPQDSLPEALRTSGIEPLAADFRKEGDGRRLAFLKIVAALIDLPLDALVQRDAQRQLRRVMAVTVGAVALMIVMALLLVITLRAQDEAERRRVTADATFRRLLTDVRRGLEGTGNVELMRNVNQVAIDYYRRQGDLAALPDDSLDLRARLLHAAGADDEKQNRLDAALSKFKEAHRTTARLLALSPNNPEALFAHAQSEFYLGLVARRQNDRANATKHWTEYRRLAETLSKAEPSSLRSFLELGYANGNLCDLSVADSYDLTAAEDQCAAALRAAQTAFITAAEPTVALANRYGALALVQVELGHYSEALASRQREAALIDMLLEIEPRNVEYGLRRSWADIGTGNIWIKAGQPSRATTILRECVRRQNRSFPADSKDTRVVEARYRAHIFLALSLKNQGQDYSAVLTEADRLQSVLASFGMNYRQKAEAIQAAVWSKGEK